MTTLKKNLIIYNYKNLSIAFGPEYTLFIHYNFLLCTDSIFISLKRHMTFFLQVIPMLRQSQRIQLILFVNQNMK